MTTQLTLGVSVRKITQSELEQKQKDLAAKEEKKDKKEKEGKDETTQD